MAHNHRVPDETGTKTPGADFNAGSASTAPSTEVHHWHTGRINWIEALLLIFLAGLALLPPIRETHKQIIIAAIALVQLIEGRLVIWSPRFGRGFAVILKILLATLLLEHTAKMAINSSYWPIYLLPIVTAATYFGTGATLVWTALISAAYSSLLFQAIQEFVLTPEALGELATRVLFFFLAAILVNRFAVEIRRRAEANQLLAEQMSIANRKLAEAQEQARRSERLAALGQMSAGLAHEIRNPLGVIKGSAEMLTQKLGQSNPLASELAGYISTETNRLSALVARFLEFARPMDLELMPGNICEVVNRALAAVAKQRPDAKVIVKRDCAQGLPQVGMEEQLCEQVFQNLALNAYEAMEPGGGKLRVMIEPARSGGREGVEVTFEDSGLGVPPEISEQIFNPFFTTKKTGVGLGLAVVSKIVDGHQGSLRLEGEPGRGARFVVFFPAARSGLSGRAGSSAPVS